MSKTEEDVFAFWLCCVVFGFLVLCLSGFIIIKDMPVSNKRTYEIQKVCFDGYLHYSYPIKTVMRGKGGGTVASYHYETREYVMFEDEKGVHLSPCQ